jgi:DNA-binding protein H-NS
LSFSWDDPMPPKKGALDTLSNEALCKLRDEIVTVLNSRAEALRKELNRLTARGLVTQRETRNKKYRRKVRTYKVAPKYRGPDGSTWSGRGLRPRWLAKEMREGRKLEDFIIALREKEVEEHAKAKSAG